MDARDSYAFGKPATFYQDERRRVLVRGDPHDPSIRRPPGTQPEAARLVVGLMSGTSADSIDVAVCRMTGQGAEVGVELLHYREHPHDPEVKRRLIGPDSLDVRGVAELHILIGEAFAAACRATLEGAGISPADVDVIGSHGQTVYHHSGIAGAIRATLQVGDGDVIAVRTGCPVISDFRARDVAAGGEGAPLSPIADAVLFARRGGEGPGRRRAILNLGGIANITLLGDDPARVFGFDTGPANAPWTGWRGGSPAARWPAIATGNSPVPAALTNGSSPSCWSTTRSRPADRRNPPGSRCTATRSSTAPPGVTAASTPA